MKNPIKNTVRKGIDVPEWRIMASAVTGLGATLVTGGPTCNDHRSRGYAHPEMLLLQSTTALLSYSYIYDAWIAKNLNGTLAGTFGAGYQMEICESQGPRGKFLSGCTTSKLNLNGLNMCPAQATWARTTTTATITTTTAHGYGVGDVLSVTVTSDAAAIVVGNVTILTAPTATTFTFTCLNAGGASGTLTIGRAVLPNQLANRGDGLGFIIRVIDKVTGKTEERRIVSNTGGFGLLGQTAFGCEPTVYLNEPLSSAPTTSSFFEILSGRVYMMTTGAVTVGMFKYYDIATQTLSGNLATSGLPTIPAVNGGTQFIPLDEQRVPCGRYPGEGFIGSIDNVKYDTNTVITDWAKRCLQATATSSTTLTGHTVIDIGDNQVIANEYRNFQIRIVEDTVTPQSVGQRAKILYHTAGSSGTAPIYTVASWAASGPVTPSSSCKYVIENNNDRMLVQISALTAVYAYINHNAEVTPNTWTSADFVARTTSHVNGFHYQMYGVNVANNYLPNVETGALAIDPSKQIKNSHILATRGSSNIAYDILDIANSASGTQAISTGAWLSGTTTKPGQAFDVSATQFLAGVMNSWIYDPNTLNGRFVYLMMLNTTATLNGVSIARFDLITKSIVPYSFMRVSYGTNGSASGLVGDKVGYYLNEDGVAVIYMPKPGSSNAEWLSLLLIVE